MNLRYVICSEIIDVRDGTHDSPKYIIDGGYPLITSKNINNNKIDFSNVNYISEEDYIKINQRSEVSNGDIIMPMIGTIGNPVIIDTDKKFAIKNVALFKLANNETILSKYFYYILKTQDIKRQLESNKRGGTQNFVSLKNIRDLKIPLIDILEQKKIVEILDKAQQLIDKRKKQIESLDELVKSQFIEMFGDPINNPMGWQVKKLKDISTKILSGNTPKGGSEVYVDSGIMFFRSQNVWKNKLVLDDIAYIDEDTHNKMLKSSLKHRDILITKTGRINTENSSLGRAAMYLGKDDKANINGHVYLIRLKEEILNEFILFILTSKEYRGYIRSVCVGGIDKRQLNKEHIEDFPIIFPPIEQQKEFVTYVKQVDKLKFEMEKSLKELEDNFNSLMQKAFKGELFN